MLNKVKGKMYSNIPQVISNCEQQYPQKKMYTRGHITKSSKYEHLKFTKYNFIQSHFEYNFSSEMSRQIAQEYIRKMKTRRKVYREVPTFAETVRNEVLYLHEYNLTVFKVTQLYPFSEEYTEFLMQYVLLECKILHKNEFYSKDKEKQTQDRVLRLLLNIYNDYFETRQMKRREIREHSMNSIIEIFVKIRTTYNLKYIILENMTVTLLKKNGHFEKIDALRDKPLPFLLDNILSADLSLSKYRNITTSDYGTDDGLPNVPYTLNSKNNLDFSPTVEDDFNENKDDIREIIVSQENLNKTSKLVYTICLDESGLDSDEEVVFISKEIENKKKKRVKNLNTMTTRPILNQSLHTPVNDQLKFNSENNLRSSFNEKNITPINDENNLIEINNSSAEYRYVEDKKPVITSFHSEEVIYISDDLASNESARKAAIVSDSLNQNESNKAAGLPTNEITEEKFGYSSINNLCQKNYKTLETVLPINETHTDIDQIIVSDAEEILPVEHTNQMTINDTEIKGASSVFESKEKKECIKKNENPLTEVHIHNEVKEEKIDLTKSVKLTTDVPEKSVSNEEVPHSLTDFSVQEMIEHETNVFENISKHESIVKNTTKVEYENIENNEQGRETFLSVAEKELITPHTIEIILDDKKNIEDKTDEVVEEQYIDNKVETYTNINNTAEYISINDETTNVTLPKEVNTENVDYTNFSQHKDQDDKEAENIDYDIVNSKKEIDKNIKCVTKINDRTEIGVNIEQNTNNIISKTSYNGPNLDMSIKEIVSDNKKEMENKQTTDIEEEILIESELPLKVHELHINEQKQENLKDIYQYSTTSVENNQEYSFCKSPFINEVIVESPPAEEEISFEILDVQHKDSPNLLEQKIETVLNKNKTNSVDMNKIKIDCSNDEKVIPDETKTNLLEPEIINNIINNKELLLNNSNKLEDKQFTTSDDTSFLTNNFGLSEIKETKESFKVLDSTHSDWIMSKDRILNEEHFIDLHRLASVAVEIKQKFESPKSKRLHRAKKELVTAKNKHKKNKLRKKVVLKNIAETVDEEKRITRSAYRKNVIENVMKPQEFKNTLPTNNVKIHKLPESVGNKDFTDSDSSDSESNKLFIDDKKIEDSDIIYNEDTDEETFTFNYKPRLYRKHFKLVGKKHTTNKKPKTKAQIKSYENNLNPYVSIMRLKERENTVGETAVRTISPKNDSIIEENESRTTLETEIKNLSSLPNNVNYPNYIPPKLRYKLSCKNTVKFTTEKLEQRLKSEGTDLTEIKKAEQIHDKEIKENIVQNKSELENDNTSKTKTDEISISKKIKILSDVIISPKRDGKSRMEMFENVDALDLNISSTKTCNDLTKKSTLTTDVEVKNQKINDTFSEHANSVNEHLDSFAEVNGKNCECSIVKEIVENSKDEIPCYQQEQSLETSTKKKSIELIQLECQINDTSKHNTEIKKDMDTLTKKGILENILKNTPNSMECDKGTSKKKKLKRKMINVEKNVCMKRVRIRPHFNKTENSKKKSQLEKNIRNRTKKVFNKSYERHLIKIKNKGTSKNKTNSNTITDAKTNKKCIQTLQTDISSEVRNTKIKNTVSNTKKSKEIVETCTSIKSTFDEEEIDKLIEKYINIKKTDNPYSRRNSYPETCLDKKLNIDRKPVINSKTIPKTLRTSRNSRSKSYSDEAETGSVQTKLRSRSISVAECHKLVNEIERKTTNETIKTHNSCGPISNLNKHLIKNRRTLNAKNNKSKNIKLKKTKKLSDKVDLAKRDTRKQNIDNTEIIQCVKKTEKGGENTNDSHFKQKSKEVEYAIKNIAKDSKQMDKEILEKIEDKPPNKINKYNFFEEIIHKDTTNVVKENVENTINQSNQTTVGKKENINDKVNTSLIEEENKLHPEKINQINNSDMEVESKYVDIYEEIKHEEMTYAIKKDIHKEISNENTHQNTGVIISDEMKHEKTNVERCLQNAREKVNENKLINIQIDLPNEAPLEKSQKTSSVVTEENNQNVNINNAVIISNEMNHIEAINTVQNEISIDNSNLSPTGILGDYFFKQNSSFNPTNELKYITDTVIKNIPKASNKEIVGSLEEIYEKTSDVEQIDNYLKPTIECKQLKTENENLIEKTPNVSRCVENKPTKQFYGSIIANTTIKSSSLIDDLGNAEKQMVTPRETSKCLREQSDLIKGTKKEKNRTLSNGVRHKIKKPLRKKKMYLKKIVDTTLLERKDVLVDLSLPSQQQLMDKTIECNEYIADQKIVNTAIENEESVELHKSDAQERQIVDTTLLGCKDELVDLLPPSQEKLLDKRIECNAYIADQKIVDNAIINEDLVKLHKSDVQELNLMATNKVVAEETNIVSDKIITKTRNLHDSDKFYLCNKEADVESKMHVSDTHILETMSDSLLSDSPKKHIHENSLISNDCGKNNIGSKQMLEDMVMKENIDYKDKSKDKEFEILLNNNTSIIKQEQTIANKDTLKNIPTSVAGIFEKYHIEENKKTENMYDKVDEKSIITEPLEVGIFKTTEEEGIKNVMEDTIVELVQYEEEVKENDQSVAIHPVQDAEVNNTDELTNIPIKDAIFHTSEIDKIGLLTEHKTIHIDKFLKDSLKKDEHKNDIKHEKDGFVKELAIDTVHDNKDETKLSIPLTAQVEENTIIDKESIQIKSAFEIISNINETPKQLLTETLKENHLIIQTDLKEDNKVEKIPSNHGELEYRTCNILDKSEELEISETNIVPNISSEFLRNIEEPLVRFDRQVHTTNIQQNINKFDSTEYTHSAVNISQDNKDSSIQELDAQDSFATSSITSMTTLNSELKVQEDNENTNFSNTCSQAEYISNPGKHITFEEGAPKLQENKDCSTVLETPDLERILVPFFNNQDFSSVEFKNSMSESIVKPKTVVNEDLHKTETSRLSGLVENTTKEVQPVELQNPPQENPATIEDIMEHRLHFDNQFYIPQGNQLANSSQMRVLDGTNDHNYSYWDCPSDPVMSIAEDGAEMSLNAKEFGNVILNFGNENEFLDFTSSLLDLDIPDENTSRRESEPFTSWDNEPKVIVVLNEQYNNQSRDTPVVIIGDISDCTDSESWSQQDSGNNQPAFHDGTIELFNQQNCPGNSILTEEITISETQSLDTNVQMSSTSLELNDKLNITEETVSVNKSNLKTCADGREKIFQNQGKVDTPSKSVAQKDINPNRHSSPNESPGKSKKVVQQLALYKQIQAKQSTQNNMKRNNEEIPSRKCGRTCPRKWTKISVTSSPLTKIDDERQKLSEAEKVEPNLLNKPLNIVPPVSVSDLTKLEPVTNNMDAKGKIIQNAIKKNSNVLNENKSKHETPNSEKISNLEEKVKCKSGKLVTTNTKGDLLKQSPKSSEIDCKSSLLASKVSIQAKSDNYLKPEVKGYNLNKCTVSNVLQQPKSFSKETIKSVTYPIIPKTSINRIQDKPPTIKRNSSRQDSESLIEDKNHGTTSTVQQGRTLGISRDRVSKNVNDGPIQVLYNRVSSLSPNDSERSSRDRSSRGGSETSSFGYDDIEVTCNLYDTVKSRKRAVTKRDSSVESKSRYDHKTRRNTRKECSDNYQISKKFKTSNSEEKETQERISTSNDLKVKIRLDSTTKYATHSTISTNQNNFKNHTADVTLKQKELVKDRTTRDNYQDKDKNLVESSKSKSQKSHRDIEDAFDHLISQGNINPCFTYNPNQATSNGSKSDRLDVSQNSYRRSGDRSNFDSNYSNKRRIEEQGRKNDRRRRSESSQRNFRSSTELNRSQQGSRSRDRDANYFHRKSSSSRQLHQFSNYGSSNGNLANAYRRSEEHQKHQSDTPLYTTNSILTDEKKNELLEDLRNVVQMQLNKSSKSNSEGDWYQGIEPLLSENPHGFNKRT